MRLHLLRLLLSLLMVSVIIYPAYSKSQKSLTAVVDKINELKALESLLDKKIAKLEHLKKQLDNQKKELQALRKQTDEYVKKKKKEADDYYANIKKQADEYIAKKQKELESLQKQIADEKIKKLAQIYAAAKPQAAADELSNMDEDTAAKILVFMKSRQAGAIISKMQPKKAARIFQQYLMKKDQLKINKQ